jgi:hypothetical protein
VGQLRSLLCLRETRRPEQEDLLWRTFVPKVYVFYLMSPTSGTGNVYSTHIPRLFRALVSNLDRLFWKIAWQTSVLEAASTHCWRQHHSVTAFAIYAMTLVTAWMAWMPWQRNMDLLVPAGTSTRLNWIQCGFEV